MMASMRVVQKEILMAQWLADQSVKQLEVMTVARRDIDLVVTMAYLSV